MNNPTTTGNKKILTNETEESKENKTESGRGLYVKDQSTNWLDGAIRVADKMSLGRIFLILSMIVYGIIAYSKREEGVGGDDLANFLLFLITVILLTIFLFFSTIIYRKWGSQNIINIGATLRKSAFSLLIFFLVVLIIKYHKIIIEQILNIINFFVK